MAMRGVVGPEPGVSVPLEDNLISIQKERGANGDKQIIIVRKWSATTDLQQ
jgi:hypothetical protein